jgi:hypothetical protein
MVVVGGNVVYNKQKDLDIQPVEPSPTMGGPFIPGKNGQINRNKNSKINKGNRKNRVDKLDNDMICMPVLAPNCACRLLGKYCIASYR